MKIRIKLLASILFLSVNVLAQNFDAIKNNPDYLYGEGLNANRDAAYVEAGKDLGRQIVFNVRSITETTMTNEQSGEDAKSSIKSTDEVKLTSTVSIPNPKRLEKKEDDGSYHVLVYVESTDVDKIFETHKQKIRNLYKFGQVAESKYKIDDALHYYYWALELITILPFEQQVSLVDSTTSLQLDAVIKDHIADMLRDCKVTGDKRFLVEEEGRHGVELQFTYKNHPIVSCDYSYYEDGYNWTDSDVKDGVAAVEVPADATKLRVRIDFQGKKQWKSDPVVEDFLSQLDQYIPFHQCQKDVTLTMLPEAKPSVVPTAQKLARELKTDSMAVAECSPVELQKQATIISPLIQAIESRNYDNVKPLCTDDGWRWFEKLVKYGKAKILDRSNIEVSAYANGYLVRGVKAKFTFKHNSKSFVEDLVFYIKDGKIDGINFGLEQNAYEDIMHHGMWDPRSRQVLVNFLENYKTAYALENLEYLDAVFAEDALIIIGNKISVDKEASKEFRESNFNNENFQKTQLTKDQYIDRLRKVFAKQEYVNIQFEDAEVKKTSQDNTQQRFQILIKQHYYSTTYADKGYLFLLADITNPEKPIIHVRVWDENKNELMKYGEWNY